jgi:hypothetical protein
LWQEKIKKHCFPFLFHHQNFCNQHFQVSLLHSYCNFLTLQGQAQSQRYPDIHTGSSACQCIIMRYLCRIQFFLPKVYLKLIYISYLLDQWFTTWTRCESVDGVNLKSLGSLSVCAYPSP